MPISNVILKLEESASHYTKKTAIYGINKNFTYEEVQRITSFFSNYLGKIRLEKIKYRINFGT